MWTRHECDCYKRHLNDTSCYKKLKIANGTKNDSKTPNLSPRISRKNNQPKFCTKLKIHKRQSRSEDCYTSNFSQYVEYDLHPTFEQILSYVKDTNDFINKVKYLSLPKDSILLKNFTRR